jgi:DNA-binding transcriptional ArsR family regulator
LEDELLDRIRTEIEKDGKASAPARRSRGSKTPAASDRPTGTKAAAKPAARRASRTPSAPAKSPPTPTAVPGTKARVLEALADGTSKTAGEVATAAGLGPGSVSTTLSKLAKSGEVVKAERGYKRPG